MATAVAAGENGSTAMTVRGGGDRHEYVRQRLIETEGNIADLTLMEEAKEKCGVGVSRAWLVRERLLLHLPLAPRSGKRPPAPGKRPKKMLASLSEEDVHSLATTGRDLCKILDAARVSFARVGKKNMRVRVMRKVVESILIEVPDSDEE